MKEKKEENSFFIFFLYFLAAAMSFGPWANRVSAYIRPLDCIVHRRRLTFLLKISAAARELFFLFLYFF